MKESALTSSNRLGGAVISDRIVASLLEELRTGRYARSQTMHYMKGLKGAPR